jgi:hypothetical protein
LQIVSVINPAMKKLLFLTMFIVIAVSCKKLEPIGPTYIRVKNMSTVIMTNLTVNTGGGEYNFGTLKVDSVSAYHKFDKAYNKANIKATINSQLYKTDTAIYTTGGGVYLGQMKATYEIVVVDGVPNKITISRLVPEEGIK